MSETITLPPPDHSAPVTGRRPLIDRHALAADLHAIVARDDTELARRAAAVEVLKSALQDAQDLLAQRLAARPGRGKEWAKMHASVIDQLVRLIHDFVLRLLARPNPTQAEHMTLVAVGGYGRGEMAPYSDIDIMFLTPWKLVPWSESVIETILYILWDLGFHVGQSCRSVDDMVALARSDSTIRTSLLEARFLCGHKPLYDTAMTQLNRVVMGRNPREFITAKLDERRQRHKRMGDSRYSVEPNLKEGKGGLRDLHTLFWIAKYAYQVHSVDDLVDKGIMTRAELRKFRQAENYLWTIRIHLHLLAGRAQERLTFDMQRALASKLHYVNRGGLFAVERFMRRYFLVAKQVGDLSRLLLTQIEDSFGRLGWLPELKRRPRHLHGFVLRGGQIDVPQDDFLQSDPVRLIQMFHLADLHGLPIHPLAMRKAARDVRYLKMTMLNDAGANGMFLDILTSPRDPEKILRWMNECGVLGRFIPDFGRIVAQMQYDMYHHYTVDEHTIRAIGILARLKSGTLQDEFPEASQVAADVVSWRVLCVAVFLHDIAKGRGGNHSELGANIALRLGPRLGLMSAETELVAWLVRYHLLMSNTAFKRDLTDFKTVSDFVATVRSPERLRLLFVLTVVDIDAVGPGVWTQWKGQLLWSLFELSGEHLRLGHKQTGRGERIAAKQDALCQSMGWTPEQTHDYCARFFDAYWVAESPEILERNARQVMALSDTSPLSIESVVDADSGLTQVSVYTVDHPGLFFRIAGAISLAGANILGARIHTTRDGMALDNILVESSVGGKFESPAQHARLKDSIADVLSGKKVRLGDHLAARASVKGHADPFDVEPNVFTDNRASNRFTVVEVNAHDRPALLYALTRTFFQARIAIHSAHISTFGARVVDVFYLTDLTGRKLTVQRSRTLERKLLDGMAEMKQDERKNTASGASKKRG